MMHLSMEGDLAWEQQTGKFNTVIYSLQLTLGFIDEQANGDCAMGGSQLLKRESCLLGLFDCWAHTHKNVSHLLNTA